MNISKTIKQQLNHQESKDFFLFIAVLPMVSFQRQEKKCVNQSHFLKTTTKTTTKSQQKKPQKTTRNRLQNDNKTTEGCATLIKICVQTKTKAPRAQRAHRSSSLGPPGAQKSFLKFVVTHWS